MKRELPYIKQNFSTTCYRKFKKFQGEITAHSATSAVAMNYLFEDMVKENKKLSEVGEIYNIKINDIKFEEAIRRAILQGIVNVYTSFETYFNNFQEMFETMQSKNWETHQYKEGKRVKVYDPIGQLKLNIDFDNEKFLNDYFVVIDYYRLVRNVFIHNDQKNIDLNEKRNLDKFYTSNSKIFSKVKQFYGMQSAPNDYESLSYHDVKLFSRLLIDFLPVIEYKLDITNERFAELLFEKYQSKPYNRIKSSNKFEQEVINYLKTEYSIDKTRSQQIYQILISQLND